MKTTTTQRTQANQTSLADQRRENRRTVSFLLNKYVRGRPYLCRAENLSRGGLQLERVFEPRLSESEVGLQFQLPGSDRVITCAGKITYGASTETTHGVKFTHVDPEHQAMIDRYLTAAAA